MAKESTDDGAFAGETETLRKFDEFSKRENVTIEEYTVGIKELFTSYKRLFGDVKMLTKMGDRQQRTIKSNMLVLKLQKEEIERFSEEVKEKNVALQETIDELTRAKASRKAATIAFSIAIGLFICTEFLENSVDAYTVAWGVWGIVASISFKLLLVVSTKPIEPLLEKQLLKSAMKEKLKEKETLRMKMIKDAENEPVKTEEPKPQRRPKPESVTA